MFFLAILFFLVAGGLAIGGRVKPFANDEDHPDDKDKRSLNDVYHLNRWALAPLALGGLFGLFSFLTIVSPGNVAVPVTFGTVGQSVGAGVHVKAPWTTYHSISVRTQEYTMVHDNGEGSKSGDDSVGVLGSDAGTANVDATILYHVDKAHASELYKKLGSDFVNKIIRPTSRTCIRDSFAGVAVVDAATDKRESTATSIRSCIDARFADRGLVLEDFQLRNIALGQQLQGSVDAKVAAQQQSQQKVFELQKAEADARITTIGAKAKADSQQILACGGTKATVKDSNGNNTEVVIPNPIGACNQAALTPAFLELQKIQALQNMVNSPNHTTLVIPEDFRGLLNVNGAS